MQCRIQNVWTMFNEKIPEEAFKELDETLSYQVSGSKFAIDGWEKNFRQKQIDKRVWELKKYHGRKMSGQQLQEKIEEIQEYWLTCELKWKWDGRQHFFDKGKNRIPTGLLRRTKRVLKAYGIALEVIDQRAIFPPTLQLKLQGINFFPDQARAIEDAVKYQRGILQAATGWGKGEVITGLLHRLQRPAIVFIHRETISRQLHERLTKRLGTKIGYIGGGIEVIRPITIAMLQTVKDPRYVSLLKTFPVMMVDEAHHIAADSFYSVAMACENAYYRYGFSATPWRDDNADMYLDAALSSRYICRISPQDLIAQNRLTKPYIYFLKNPPINKYWGLSFQKQYAKCIVDNEFRNTMAIQTAYAMWKRKKTFLIAVTQVQHGKDVLKMMQRIYPGIKVPFIKGEDESQQKQKVLRLLSEKKIPGVIATAVYGEGIDVPGLDGIINLKAQESKVDVMQLLGRALRKFPGKDAAYFIDFYDGEKYTQKHSRTRSSILKEEGFTVKKLNGVEDLEKEMDQHRALADSL